MPKKAEKRIVKGEKVYLRFPNPDDCAELIQLNQASVDFHRDLVNSPKDQASFSEYLKRNELESNEIFLIIQITNRKIAGAINLSQIFRGIFQNAYLGYYLGESFTGQGLMKEAVALILKYAFTELQLHRVEANVQPHNHASIAVLRANNFSKEGFSEKYLNIGGQWRDHERWAIVRENWRG